MNNTTHPEIGATDGNRDVVLSREERALIMDCLEHGTQSLHLEAVRLGNAFPRSSRDDLLRHEALLSRFRLIDEVS